MICSSAPFWHIYFKDNQIKALTKEYVKLNAEVTSSNKVKSDLIKCLVEEPKDQTTVDQLVIAQIDYQKKYDIALAAYKNIKAIRAENKVLFFPNMEKLVYNIGIAIFLLYVSFSLILFYRNRRSENRLYLVSIKIKSFLILLGALYFIVYILYPADDFANIAYALIAIVFASLGIYSSILLSSYIKNLEKEVSLAKIGVVSFIKLVGNIKNKYLFPFAKLALKSKNGNQSSINSKLNQLDSEIEETLKSVAQ